MELLSTVRGSVQVVHSSYSIAPFSSGVHPSEHEFYINWFFKEDGQNLRTEHCFLGSTLVPCLLKVNEAQVNILSVIVLYIFIGMQDYQEQ